MNTNKKIGKYIMKKEKTIETQELLITGNIMSWKGTMIQLSNVSCISTEPLAQDEFPKLSILLLLIGFWLFKSNFILSLLFLASGGGWIYLWYPKYQLRSSQTILNICMNAGLNLKFLFKSRSFLDDVLRVLERIILEGGVGEQNVSINISRCNFSGNAQVLNDLNLSKG